MTEDEREAALLAATERAGRGTRQEPVLDTPGAVRFTRHDGVDLLRIDVAPTQQTVLYVRGPQGQPRTQRDVALRRKLAALGVGEDWRAMQVRWSWDDALAKARYFAGLDPRVRTALVMVRTVPIDGLVLLPEELDVMTTPPPTERPAYRNRHVLAPGNDDDYYGVNR